MLQARMDDWHAWLTRACDMHLSASSCPSDAFDISASAVDGRYPASRSDSCTWRMSQTAAVQCICATSDDLTTHWL